MKSLASLAFTALIGGAAIAQVNQISIDRALTLARANRASVAAAQLRLVSARLTRRGLGAFPATRLFLGISSPAEVGGSDDDLVLAQPIDLFGRTSASRAVGDATVARAEAELQQAIAQLQADVIEQYSEVAAARALADSAAKSQDIAQRLNDAIKVLVDEGRLPGVQLTRVGIEVERIKLAAEQRRAEEEAAIQRLSGLLNQPSQNIAVLGFADIRVELIEPAALQRQRADLLLLAAEVRAAEAEAKVASLGNRPELEIQGRRTAWQEPEQRYGVRIQLAFPISDFGRSRAETAAARTLANAARKALDDATRIAQSELEAARIELTSATEQVGRYQTMLESARSLAEKSRIGFTERAITLIELLEATRALREIEEGYVEAQLRLARAQAAYLRASGRILEVGK